MELLRRGNPNPTYYTIAKNEFGASGNSNCYSINQPPRHGLGTACAFYDITQGDNNVNCRANSSSHQVGCYLDAETNGVLSTQTLNTTDLTADGSGYANTLTCAIGAPSNLYSYLSPPGGTLWGGGSQATCSVTVSTATGTLTVSGTVATGWAGTTVTIGSTVYTLHVSPLTAVNQILLHTSGNTATNRTDTAKNIEAVINATSGQCADTGCVFTGQVANSAATATETTNVVNLTAVTSGTGGDFTVGSSVQADIASASTNGGIVNALNIVSAGQGYAGGTSCAISGGGGSGATCTVYPSVGTAAPAYQPAYGATPGWDFATGIGSVNAYNLVFNSAW